jgi:AAA domain
MSATFNSRTSSTAECPERAVPASESPNHPILDRAAEGNSAAPASFPARLVNFVGTVIGLGDDAVTLATSYFDRNRNPQPEVVEGLLCESKITVLGGDYGVGKSPLIADLVLHITSGLECCGRKVEKRPVIHFDFETPATKYKTDLENGAKRLGVPVPPVPDMLQPFFQNDDISEPGTAQLVEAQVSDDKCFALLETLLTQKPNAVVIFDPVELFVSIDKNDGKAIVRLFRRLRKLFTGYPHASILCTFNLKKADKKYPGPNLLTQPRDWLDEVSGAKEIMSRSDIRLGIAFFDNDQTVRVINGVQRGEPFNPLLIQPAGDPEAGFELCPPDMFSLGDVLTARQVEYWHKLPTSFTFNEGLAKVPRSSLSRLIHRAKSVGLLRSENDKWIKAVHPPGSPGKLELVN